MKKDHPLATWISVPIRTVFMIKDEEKHESLFQIIAKQQIFQPLD